MCRRIMCIIEISWRYIHKNALTETCMLKNGRWEVSNIKVTLFLLSPDFPPRTGMYSLPETKVSQKRKLVFQPSIFRCELLVSGRLYIHPAFFFASGLLPHWMQTAANGTTRSVFTFLAFCMPTWAHQRWDGYSCTRTRVGSKTTWNKTNVQISESIQSSQIQTQHDSAKTNLEPCMEWNFSTSAVELYSMLQSKGQFGCIDKTTSCPQPQTQGVLEFWTLLQQNDPFSQGVWNTELETF